MPYKVCQKYFLIFKLRPKHIVFHLDSQLNEIDALLSELNELQSNLEFGQQHNTQFLENVNQKSSYIDTSFVNTSSSGISSKASTQSPSQANFEKKSDLEGIDQQFDEVLKFLAQSINDHGSSPVLSSESLSSISLLATPNSDNNSETDNSKKIETKTENSSKSSGIGEDIYESSNNELPVLQIDSKKSQMVTNSKESVNINSNQNKRNSSDSAFIDTVPVTASLSLSMIASSKNKNQISNPIFLHSSMNMFNSGSTSSGHGSDKSPNSQTESINSNNSVNSNVVKAVRKNYAQNFIPIFLNKT